MLLCIELSAWFFRLKSRALLVVSPWDANVPFAWSLCSAPVPSKPHSDGTYLCILHWDLWVMRWENPQGSLLAEHNQHSASSRGLIVL